MKTTIVLTTANQAFLRAQEGNLSETINDILQQHRTLGPMLERMAAPKAERPSWALPTLWPD